MEELHYLLWQSVSCLGTSHGQQSSLHVHSEVLMYTLLSIAFYEECGSDVLATHSRLLGLLLCWIKPSCSWLAKPSSPTLCSLKKCPSPHSLHGVPSTPSSSSMFLLYWVPNTEHIYWYRALKTLNGKSQTCVQSFFFKKN